MQKSYVLILECVLTLLFFQGHIPLFAQDSSNTVIEGDARFQVLTPTLIRMEYSGDGTFEDRLSFNVINRDFQEVPFTTDTINGWRFVKTDKLELRYKTGSGAFSASNISVTLKTQENTIYPIDKKNEPFTFGSVNEAENAELSEGAGTNDNHTGYTGNGFVDGYWSLGAETTWYIYEVPNSGDYTLTIRYANGAGGDGRYETRTLSLYINGVDVKQIELPKTAGWNAWRKVQTTVSLEGGGNSILLKYDSGDGGNVNIDHISVTELGAPLPDPDSSTPGSDQSTQNLGGWIASLDGADKPVSLNDGLLTREGWYYLDDSKTNLWTEDGWTEPRGKDAIYQDGYFFGYNNNYKKALQDLATLTGSSPLLPRYAFGNWFSRYHNYSDSEYKNIVSKFRSSKIPLDVLVIDTDWKSPNSWNGWNWNTKLFPDPQQFLNWAKNEGLHTSLNLHANIMNTDSKYQKASEIANNTLINQGSAAGDYDWMKKEDGRLPVSSDATQYTWNWSERDHAESYFWLHDVLRNEGKSGDFWWLDDWDEQNWVNHLYAKRMNDRGERPMYFARIKGNNPFAEHRSTIHFTGDTHGTWALLDFIPYFTVREGNIGLPYISHDIGSHLGGKLQDDMYIRWVQLGTFMPILRLHSAGGARLPWEYAGKTQEIATKFLRLRHSIIPYLYTVARESHDTGLPMVRGMYLEYPVNENAYLYDRQYMLGNQLLVAPVTTSGNQVSEKVWFPEGTWIDFFTGKVYEGPKVQTVSSSLEHMPVFVKAGGIIPRQQYMKNVNEQKVDTLILEVFPGSNGNFNLYEDKGSGHEYQTRSYTFTPLNYAEAENNTLKIGPTEGTYEGRIDNRSYKTIFINVEKPDTVTVNGNELMEILPESGEGWWHDTTSYNLHVHVNQRATSNTVTITHDGMSLNQLPNKSPTADAGNDQTFIDEDGNSNETITLDGSNSTDPDGTIINYEWTKDGTIIAVGENPRVTLDTGVYVITLTVTDNDGATSQDEVTIEITSTATSIENPDGCTDLSIYPSPVSEVLHVKEQNGNVDKIRIFNSTGVKVKEVTNCSQVVVSELAEGLYIIKVTVDKRHVIKK